MARPTIKQRQIAALKERKPGAGFAKFVFPLIQRMAEVDIVDQIVALQPMAEPTAQAMYMDIVMGPPRRKPANIIDENPGVNETAQRELEEAANRRIARQAFSTVFGLLLGSRP